MNVPGGAETDGTYLSDKTFSPGKKTYLSDKTNFPSLRLGTLFRGLIFMYSLLWW